MTESDITITPWMIFNMLHLQPITHEKFHDSMIFQTSNMMHTIFSGVLGLNMNSSNMR